MDYILQWNRFNKIPKARLLCLCDPVAPVQISNPIQSNPNRIVGDVVSKQKVAVVCWVELNWIELLVTGRPMFAQLVCFRIDLDHQHTILLSSNTNRADNVFPLCQTGGNSQNHWWHISESLLVNIWQASQPTDKTEVWPKWWNETPKSCMILAATNRDLASQCVCLVSIYN